MDVSSLKNLISRKNSLSVEEKKELLCGLKRLKQNSAEKVSEYSNSPERNVISRQFNIEDEFRSYVNKHRGVEFAPKELDTIERFSNEIAPLESNKFMVRFETSDDFGNNTTAIIKKFKQGNQFIFGAFIQTNPSHPDLKDQEEDEQENNPEEVETPPDQQPNPNKLPKLKELLNSSEASSNINVIKSIPFDDEIEGADVLSDFLRKIDL